MAGQQGAASPSGIIAKIGLALAALAPPALVGAGFWPEVRSSPLLSAVALVVYLLVLAALRFAGRVGSVVGDKWVPRVAEAVDRTVSAVLLGYRSTYLTGLRRSVRDIELLGVATQGMYTLRLRDVYVELSVLPRALHETSQEPFVGTLTGSAERRTLDSFLGGVEPGVFAVIGGPGSGKTTLLRHTALDLCRRGFRRRPLPVLLPLRDHIKAIIQEPEPTLDTVAASVTWIHGRVPADWLERRLDKGRCLVMLDGLDEVAAEEDRRKVVAWVKRQTTRYPNNDYVLTSRPHGYLANPVSNADVLVIRRFTGEQISRFIQEWYYTIECRSIGESGAEIRAQSRTKANDLLHRLPRQPALYDLAANPLLLTMLANVHRYRGALPGSRAELYGEMCQVLLHRRQEAKGLPAGDTGLRGEQKERVARQLALHMMTEQIRDLPVEQARYAITPALERVARNVMPQDFLTEAEKNGLLVEREAGEYAFVHLTLQEYLAAAEIRDLHRADLLARHVDDQWWRETTLLWAAGADASPVITACLDSGSVRALELAFDCADEAREVAPDIREDLEQLLTAPQNTDCADTGQTIENAAARPSNGSREARHRVITAVKVARSLRNILWLREDATVFVKPITKEIYSLFVDNEKSQGRYHSPDGEGDAAAHSGEAAVGMWASDAARFVSWVNGLFDDGTAYRLPSQDELAEIGLITDLTRHSVWAQGDPQPRLFCPVSVLHPYQLTIDQLRRILRTDHDRTSPVLFLTLVLVLARDLDLDRALASALDHALAQALSLDRTRGRTHDHDLNRALDHALAQALSRDRTRGHGRDRARNLALARALARAHGLAHTYDFDNLALDRDLALALDLDLDLDRALNRARILVLDRDIDRVLRVLPTSRRVALSASSNITKIRIVTLAYALLIALWIPRRRKLNSMRVLAEFNKFLKDVLRKLSQESFILPERAAGSIQRIESLLESHWHPQSAKLCNLAQRIVHDVRDLVIPILTREATYDAGAMNCARIGLVAVAAFADRMSGMAEAHSLLCEVICCLAVVQQRVEGGILPNEVIVMVRT